MRIESMFPTQLYPTTEGASLIERLKDIPLVYHFIQRERLTGAGEEELREALEQRYFNTYQADAAMGTYLELGQLEQVKTFIEAGHRGSPTVLCQLIRCGAELLPDYLEQGVRRGASSELGRYYRVWERHILLLAAARCKEHNAVQLLLDAGSDISYRHPVDLPYRPYSCHNPKHLIGLLQAPIAIQLHPLRRWPCALDYAVATGDLALVDLLLENGAESKQALLIAAVNPNPQVLQRLFEQPWIDLESRSMGWEAAGETALLRAAIADQSEHVRLLLEAGANIKAEALLIKGDKKKPVTIWDYASNSPRVLEVLKEREHSSSCTIL